MDIAVNAEVYCTDGYFGHLIYLILNPVDRQITHVVIEEDALGGVQRLVPIDLVSSSSAAHVELACTREEVFDRLDPFIRTEFLQSNVPDYMLTMHLMWPYVMSDVEMKTIEHESIPPGELAVRRGTRVEATDGYVGHVGEFVINPENGFITHLVLDEGHLWWHKMITIPVSEIDHIEDNTVYLKLDKHAIGRLPPVPLDSRENSSGDAVALAQHDESRR
jgi:sporulation protein YlmC with PRC-barrel domain